jgi:CRP-like cAMP-binding protein/GNAT superfamily N-acetyltransferase
MTLSIRIATTTAEKEAVFRLRYEIYVEEMGRRQTYADHERRRIEEPSDERGHLFLAEDGGEVVATARMNFRRDGPLECEELYDTHKFSPFFPQAASMTTKLMVRPSHRNGGAAALVAMRAYEFARENGIRIDFIDTNPHLVRLYQQLGYRIYRDNIQHPDYGSVIPMVLLMEDLDNLERVRSPLRRPARRFDNGHETAAHFNKTFTGYSAIRPAFVGEPDELWDALAKDLHRSPGDALSFLRGLPPDEAKDLLTRGDLLFYRRGEAVIREGEESAGMFCLVDGQAEVLMSSTRGQVRVAVLNGGDVFGEMGFVNRTRRNAEVRIRQDARVLVLTRAEFEKLERAAPRAALGLLKNLFEILSHRFAESSRVLTDLRATAELRRAAAVS